MSTYLRIFWILCLAIFAFSTESQAHVIGEYKSCVYFYNTKLERYSKRPGRPRWFIPLFEVVHSDYRLKKLEDLAEPRAIGDGFEKPYFPNGKTVELKESEVSNQCQTYECYLFSVINFINVYNKNRKENGAPTISSEYLVANKFLEHIKEGVLKGTEDPSLVHDLEGGFPYEAVHLTRKVGLIPQSAWRGKPLDSWDTAKIYRMLGKGVPEAHAEAKALAIKLGSKKAPNWTAPEVQELMTKNIDKLTAAVLEITGVMPEKYFTHNNENFDAQAFERRYGLPRLNLFSNHDRELYDVPENLDQVLEEAIIREGGRYQRIKVSKEELIASVKGSIDGGMPIIVDLTWKNDGHSMLIVGYEINDAGNIVRFKVMNSWGKSFGNTGHAWYTPEDLGNNATGTYRFEAPAN